MRLGWIGVTLVACTQSAPAAPPPGVAQVSPDRDNAGDMVDSVDRCTVLRHGCPRMMEDDGCPEVSLAPNNACADPTHQLLVEAAAELAREPRLTTLEIRGDKVGAECARDRMLATGLLAERLLVVAGTGDVHFATRAWAGSACR